MPSLSCFTTSSTNMLVDFDHSHIDALKTVCNGRRSPRAVVHPVTQTSSCNLTGHVMGAKQEARQTHSKFIRAPNVPERLPPPRFDKGAANDPQRRLLTARQHTTRL